MSSGFGINPIASPLAHVDPIAGVNPEHGRSNNISKDGMVNHKQAERGTEGIDGKHTPGDMTGADKMGSAVLPNLAFNPTHADFVNDKLLPAVFFNQLPAQIPKEAPGQPSEIPRYWVHGDQDPNEPSELPNTPLYPMNVHEIHIVDEPTFELESWGEGSSQYLPFQEFEVPEKKEEESKADLADEFVNNQIMVDEAFSWNGHMSEYHYSPETLHTNSISLVSSLLPFRVPMSHQ